MIGDDAVAVIVRYGDNGKLIDQLHAVGPKRLVMRRLQRFTVTMPQGMLGDLLERGFVAEMHPGVYVQTMDSLYTESFGLDVFRAALTGEETIL